MISSGETIRNMVGEERPKKGVLAWLRFKLFQLFAVILLLFLPFVVYIRTATTLNSKYGWQVWLAILAGLFAAGLLIWVYLWWFRHRSGRKFAWKRLKWQGLILFSFLLLYTGFTMWKVQRGHAKSEEVYQEYDNMHPLLRLSLGTILVFGEDILITDLSRSHEDYRKMGLRAIKNSLHYLQDDGYSHALDIKTKGRAEIRNFLVKSYFSLMGFQTLRHTGTADHLHISLAVYGKDGVL